MMKLLIYLINARTEQMMTEAKISAILGRVKKSDTIKIRIPKKYAEMIPILAAYNIQDCEQLEKIIKCGIKTETK